jgi:hypothetical protein
MTVNAGKNFADAMNILEDTGLLLLQGLEIPDVCRLIASKRIKGSCGAIRWALRSSRSAKCCPNHSEVTVTKLISGKVTFVHRHLCKN